MQQGTCQNCFLGYTVTSDSKGITAVNVQNNKSVYHVTLFKDIPIIKVHSSDELAAELKSLFLRLREHSTEAPYSLMIDWGCNVYNSVWEFFLPRSENWRLDPPELILTQLSGTGQWHVTSKAAPGLQHLIEAASECTSLLISASPHTLTNFCLHAQLISVIIKELAVKFCLLSSLPAHSFVPCFRCWLENAHSNVFKIPFPLQVHVI